ncbi:MAG TPA: radical SAM family heme chaperone HemW, partial [Gammaproteobacteria bacterium]|nr:radical SAM family heme chaperone HemW [Gammaproteobacteria bacterium]
FAGFRAAGVTRLSIGVQSFDPQKLEVLGRIHSSDEARRAAGEAKAAGFDNFNLDLMYALPRQSLEEARHDVLEAVALEPSHLSHYQLTLEPNTLFHAHPPVLPDDDAAWEMQVECQERLAEQGFVQYEVSAYAKPGFECRHNLNYWRFGDYLGLGAGAHGKLTDEGGGVTRLWKVKHPEAYLAAAGSPASLGGVNAVAGEELAFEYMLNRLRLTMDLGIREFEAATGLPVALIERSLERALSLKLLETTAQGWRTTQRGRACLNDLQSLFLPAESASRKVNA